MICSLSALLRPTTIEILLSVLSIAAGGYFAFRYFSMKCALRELNCDLREIQTDLAQNRILRLPLPARELEQFVKSVNDTLELIRLERQSYAERERKFQKQIENISHDLRTPLTVILGYLKWIKKRASLASEDVSPETTSEQAEFLDIIEGNARAMERLVSQFYLFSRLNAQDYALEQEETDVRRMLTESLASHTSILEKASLRLSSRLPEHPVTVLGNRDALERIFANLFQNAARYAHSYLRIRMEDSESQVRIFFQNDSTKITEEDLPHLFDRFYRSDPARGQNSSGLGLTVAKSLAELMGGRLDVKPIDEVPETQDTPKMLKTEKKSETSEADGISLITVCFILTLPKSAS